VFSGTTNKPFSYAYIVIMLCIHSNIFLCTHRNVFLCTHRNVRCGMLEVNEHDQPRNPKGKCYACIGIMLCMHRILPPENRQKISMKISKQHPHPQKKSRFIFREISLYVYRTQILQLSNIFFYLCIWIGN